MAIVVSVVFSTSTTWESVPETSVRNIIQGCWKVFSPTRKERSYSDRIYWVSYILFI